MGSSGRGPVFATELTAPTIKVTGSTGAANQGRFVGVTTSGAPTSGTYGLGDFVVTRNGQMWACTAAGTPGTWTTPADQANYPATGDETVQREAQISSAWSSGQLRLSYFTARRTYTAATVSLVTVANTATLTFARAGVYSVASNGDITLIGSTPASWDGSFLTAANTLYTVNLTTQPSIVAGNRYAVGLVLTTSAGTINLAHLASSPRSDLLSPTTAAFLAGQTDLATPVAVGSLVGIGAKLWARIAP